MAAARAIWKGDLKLGKSGIPVKLYSAVQDRTVHFHLLERRTHERGMSGFVNTWLTRRAATKCHTRKFAKVTK
jgi:non-homologous end joining protein Ku